MYETNQASVNTCVGGETDLNPPRLRTNSREKGRNNMVADIILYYRLSTAVALERGEQRYVTLNDIFRMEKTFPSVMVGDLQRPLFIRSHRIHLHWQSDKRLPCSAHTVCTFDAAVERPLSCGTPRARFGRRHSRLFRLHPIPF